MHLLYHHAIRIRSAEMDNKMILGVVILGLAIICVLYSVRQYKKNQGKNIRTRNTWYVFFPDNKNVPDLMESKKLQSLGNWMKNGNQLYSISGDDTLTKEGLEKVLKEEYKEVKFDITNTADLYTASYFL